VKARGLWQKTRLCGSCGTGAYVGEPRAVAPKNLAVTRGAVCGAVDLNRPGGKCDHRVTVYWLWVR
jgi:hypothetical protein